jgi:ribosomal protein L37AE/L43A
MMTCPACLAPYYETYSNGAWKTGYCQHCGLETKVETKEKDEVYLPVINKPKPKNRFSE